MGLSYLTNCRYYNRMVEDFRRKKTLPKSTLFGNAFLVDLTVLTKNQIIEIVKS